MRPMATATTIRDYVCVKTDGAAIIARQNTLLHHQVEFEDSRRPLAFINIFAADPGLCPICGERVQIMDTTADGRLIGSCGDAFTAKQWEND